MGALKFIYTENVCSNKIPQPQSVFNFDIKKNVFIFPAYAIRENIVKTFVIPDMKAIQYTATYILN